MVDGNGSDLMSLFNEGSPKAFQAVWDEFYTRLVYLCEQYVSSKGLAEEIASDAFTKCFLKKGGFASYFQLRSFLYTTARNGAIDHYRLEKRLNTKQEQYFKSLGSADQINEEIDGAILHKLSLSIENLPPRAKEVIQLLYQNKLSYHQIAEQLAISIRTVINVRAYAIKIMRRDLRPREFRVVIAFFILLAGLLK